MREGEMIFPLANIHYFISSLHFFFFLINSIQRCLHKLGLLGVGNYTLNLITLHTCGNVMGWW